MTEETNVTEWDESQRGPRMIGATGNRIWKYPMPVLEKFKMMLPRDAKVLRIDNIEGHMWMWCQVDTSKELQERAFYGFKAGGTMPVIMGRMKHIDNAAIYIQQELMLYYYEDLMHGPGKELLCY